MLDQSRRLLAFRFAHRLDDADLRNSAEIILDGRRPTGGGHVEIDVTGKLIAVLERLGTPVPWLLHDIDAERSAMCEQRALIVVTERRQRRPEVGGLFRQLLRPVSVADVDGLGRSGFGEPRRLHAEPRILRGDLQAGV